MERRSSDRRAAFRSNRTALVVLALACGWAVAQWAILGAMLHTAAGRSGVELSEVLQLDDPEFQDAFKEQLGDMVDPLSLLRATGGRAFAVLLVAVGVFGWWLSARRVLWPLVLVPLLVGAGLVPGLIRETIDALAEAGLSHPALLGVGMAESCGAGLVGLVLSLVLLAGGAVLGARHAGPGQEAGSGSNSG